MKLAHDNKIIGAAILTPMFFGFSFLASKICLNILISNPIDIISFRFLFAAILMVVLRITKFIDIDLKGKNLKIVLMLSLFYPTLSFIFEIQGINMTTSAESGMMVSLVPVFTSLLAIPVLKEYPGKKQMFFIILSTAGVFFINYMQKQLGGKIIGNLMLLISVFFGSMYSVLTRKASLEFKAEEITYIMILMGAIVFNSISFVSHIILGDIQLYFKPLLNLKFLISILYLAFVCSVISFFLMNYLYSKIEASRVSVILNIATIISIFAGAMILKERLCWYHIMGIIMILVGVWGTNHFIGKSVNEPCK